MKCFRIEFLFRSYYLFEPQIVKCGERKEKNALHLNFINFYIFFRTLFFIVLVLVSIQWAQLSLCIFTERWFCYILFFYAVSLLLLYLHSLFCACICLCECSIYFDIVICGNLISRIKYGRCKIEMNSLYFGPNTHVTIFCKPSYFHKTQNFI